MIGGRLILNVFAHRGDTYGEGRTIAGAGVGPSDHVFSLGHGSESFVRKIVDERHQEVTGSHGGIAHLQFEKARRRIEFKESVNSLHFGAAIFGERVGLGAEGREAFVQQRTYGAADDERDEFFRRVIGTGSLPSKKVWRDS